MRTLAAVCAISMTATTASAQPSMELAPPSLTPIQPLDQPEQIVTSYRAQTLTADALSLGLIALSWASEGKDGRDSGATGPLFLVGLLGGAYATPIIHGVHGHGSRGLASWLIRSGTMTVGMILAIDSETCGPDVWFCGIDRAGFGLAGGIAAASLIDAVFFTDEVETVHRGRSETAWSPIIAPAKGGGGTFGVAAAF